MTNHLRDMREKDPHYVMPVVGLVKKAKSDQVLEHAADVLAKLDDSSVVLVLKEAAGRDLNPDLQVHLARVILDLRDPSGFAVLLKLLDAAALRKWWTERRASIKGKSMNKRFE